MNRTTTLFPLVTTVILLSGLSTPAFAEAGTTGESPAHASRGSALSADVEIDPIAFALDGYSLHVGIGWERLRLDLGAFAIALPELFHGNEGFASSFDGFGAKLQYFLFAKQTGAFVGLNTGVNRMLIQREGTDLASRHSQYNLGVQVGWRFELMANFFAAPWIGVDYSFNAPDVDLAGQIYENTSWSVFPTVHLGYRFR